LTGDDGDGSRKGRSNAILTYETVAGLDNKLTEVSTKLDNLYDKVSDREAGHADHEARIRSLELSLAGLLAAGSSSVKMAAWFWGAIITLATLGMGVLNYLK